MGRGLGHVQRAICATFDGAPSKRFTVQEMAAIVYPFEAIEKRHTDAVHRALTKLAPVIGLTKCRVALPEGLGWRHVWGKY